MSDGVSYDVLIASIRGRLFDAMGDLDTFLSAESTHQAFSSGDEREKKAKRYELHSLLEALAEVKRDARAAEFNQAEFDRILEYFDFPVPKIAEINSWVPSVAVPVPVPVRVG